MTNTNSATPTIQTVLSPALLDLYELPGKTVVIIDVLRASSTIITALYNGAKEVIPVDSVSECIKLGSQLEAITAGERDGKIAEGLQYGNSPSIFTSDFIKGKTLVLTTTNGTRLLQEALSLNAGEIVIGSFPNLSSLCSFLKEKQQNVVLACAAWRNKVNIEDTLFAGAVISRLKDHFTVMEDSSRIAESLYNEAGSDLFEYMKNRQANHFFRLINRGVESDIRYCLSENLAGVVPVYSEGRLVIRKD